MRLVELHMFNWCQYEHRVVRFSPGLTAIVGLNGAGKSNIVAAVRLMLTGDNQNPGTLSDNVRRQAAPGALSMLMLQFVVNGATYVAWRVLAGPPPKLTMDAGRAGDAGLYRWPGELDTLPTTPFDGERVASGVSGVKSAMATLLGVPPAVINEVSLVAQEDLWGFLSQTDAVRAASFQRLFSLDAAAKGKAALDAVAKTLPPLTHVDLDALNTGLTAAEQAAGIAFAELQRWGPLAALQENQRGLQAMLGPATLAASTAQEHVAITGRLPQLRDAQAQAARKAAELITRVDALASQVVAARQQLNQLTGSLQIIDLAAAQRQAHAAVTEQVSRLEARVAQPPPRQVTEQEVQEARRLGDIVRTEFANCTRFVETFQTNPACPTCGTELSSEALQRRFQEAVARLPTLREGVDNAAAMLAELTQACTAYAVWRSAHDNDERSLAGLRGQLAGMAPPAETPGQDRGSVEAAAADMSRRLPGLEQACTAARQDYDCWFQENARLVAQLESDEARLVVLELQRRHQQQPVVELAEVHRQLEVVSQMIAARLAAERQHATATAALETARDAHRQGVETAARQVPLRALREDLEEAAGLLSWDGAPRWVCQQQLARLENSINRCLEALQADFRVRASEGLSFVALRPGDAEEPANRLSGGQRVVLVLGFRISIAMLIAADVGLLLLDEPTAYLDDRHITGFEALFEQLRRLAADTGLQMILVTHEERLAPLFDTVVAC